MAIGFSAGVALAACRASADPAPKPEPVPVASAAGSAEPVASQEPAAPPDAASTAGPKRYAFDFDDADLPELVRLLSAVTGKRFVVTGNLPKLHATVHAPEPVTAEEAYQAFLTILQANGLTVVPRGPMYVIVRNESLVHR